MKKEKTQHGKRLKTEKKRIRIPKGMVLILALSSLLIIVIAERWITQEAKVNILGDNTIGITKEAEEVFEKVDVSQMPETIKGHRVIGKIEIEKIGIEKYILEDTTDESLGLGVTRFWGPKVVNEIGNLCIIGHNYPNLFRDLYQLEIGDTLYIIGNDGKKIDYTVTEIVPKVEKNEMSHIEQNNDGKRKLTLITCNVRRTYEIHRKGRAQKSSVELQK